jgi:integrase
MYGIRREKGSAQTGKRPLLTEDLRQMVSVLRPDRIRDTRDRALALLGFAGAFRRSELVTLDVDDLELNRDGLIASIRRSKTDQERQGRQIGIPHGSSPETCPVRALLAWLDVLGSDAGPVFRRINRHSQIAGRRLTAQSVALVLKRMAEHAGLPPDEFAGHSLRSGHRSLATVRRYIRSGSRFLENAASKVGL